MAVSEGEASKHGNALNSLDRSCFDFTALRSTRLRCEVAPAFAAL